tara:strand:- start:1482 stop:1934 length:453 start_codon:yes stop_codon:yes gene_type:complete
MSLVDDILDAHSKRDSATETMDTHGTIIYHGEERIEKRFGKICWAVGTFEDLKGIHNGQWQVLSGNEVVRDITYGEDEVTMVSGLGEELIIPLETKIFYEPWEMDRGSYIFKIEQFERPCKLMTEWDEITPKTEHESDKCSNEGTGRGRR